MNILLVRPDGIGDEILCLPVATALRRSFPGLRIVFLSSAQAAPVLMHHPDVDSIVSLTGLETFSELVGLFGRRYDAAVFLKPFKRLMLAAFAARVPLRVATGYRWYSFLANRRVYQHRHDFSKHETEYNVGLLCGLGLAPEPVTVPKLVVTKDEHDWACRWLAELPEPRVIVHPGGLSARRWQGAHYWELARRLAKDGFGVILSGTAAEQRQFSLEAEQARCPEQGVMDLMGQLTVRELMAVIGASQVVVSGATGPAHIAAALGIATVSLFDPRRNNLPVRWRPLGRGLVLRPDVPTCEKCVYQACPYWDCLDRISPEQVVKKVQEAVGCVQGLTVVHV